MQKSKQKVFIRLLHTYAEKVVHILYTLAKERVFICICSPFSYNTPMSIKQRKRKHLIDTIWTLLCIVFLIGSLYIVGMNDREVLKTEIELYE